LTPRRPSDLISCRQKRDRVLFLQALKKSLFQRFRRPLRRPSPKVSDTNQIRVPTPPSTSEPLWADDPPLVREGPPETDREVSVEIGAGCKT